MTLLLHFSFILFIFLLKCFYWNGLDFEHALLGCQGPRDDERTAEYIFEQVL